MVLHEYRRSKPNMKSPRSAPIAFRFDPTTKAALHLIADRDGRSMANMMEWLIRKHCEKESLGWPPAGIETPTAAVKKSSAKAKAVKPEPRQAGSERKKN
jgi:hypothetical protein